MIAVTIDSKQNIISASLGSGAESTWRQIGFVRFNIPPEHVVRLLLPDVIVFLGSLVTLCVNLYVVRLCRSGRVGGGEGVSEGAEETKDLEENEAKPSENCDLSYLMVLQTVCNNVKVVKDT